MDQWTLFEKQVSEIAAEIETLNDDYTKEHVEQTAQRLEKLQYAPPVAIDIAAFLRLDKSSLLIEVKNLCSRLQSNEDHANQKQAERCIQSINVLVYYYKKLLLLRGDDPESWDEIDELYVHD